MTKIYDYPELNIPALYEAAKGAYDEGITVERLHTQTAYLPSLSTKIIEIDSALRLANHRMKDTLQAFSLPITISLELINRYQEASNRAPDASKPGIISRIINELTKILNAAKETQGHFVDLMTPLLQKVEIDATHRFLVQLAAEAELIPMQIETLTLRKAQLDDERKTLTDAITLIESKGFAQVGKDTILNAQELMKLATTTPELAMLDQAIQFAHKVLEEAQALISYTHLTRARDTVRDQITALLAEMEHKNQALTLVNLRRDMITAAHRFDTHHTVFASEFGKISTALDVFLTAHIDVDLQDESLREHLIDAISGLVSYLDSIQQGR